MTLADILPLARSLTSDDRRALAEQLWLSLDDDPVDPEILRLIEQRATDVQQHPENCLDWTDFEKLLDDRLGSVPA